MKICLISLEIFSWGKYGGFGRATRIIGRELVKRGHKIYAVVPQRQGQRRIEELDGMTVLAYPQFNPFYALKLFRKCNADIYHSEEPSFTTYLAQKSMPHKKHVITFRDVRLLEDWLIEFKHPSRKKIQVISNYIYENNLLVSHAIHKADSLHTAAECLISKARQKYHLTREIHLLPTPVFVPQHIQKSTKPTVCFIGRWDRVKRPEIFLELAKHFPEIQFIAVGKSQNSNWDNELRGKYLNTPNIELPGLIDQFTSDELSNILQKSWILINTSAKEGLPNSFLEASAHKCAILSAINPDNFTSRGGYIVTDQDYVNGLKNLLINDKWKILGEKGCKFVNATFEIQKAIDAHIKIYQRLLMPIGR